MLSEGNNDSIITVDPVIVLKTIETNTMGPLKLIQALVPYMKEKTDARIINISSGMGQLAEMGPRAPGYRLGPCAITKPRGLVLPKLKPVPSLLGTMSRGRQRRTRGVTRAWSRARTRVRAHQ